MGGKTNNNDNDLMTMRRRRQLQLSLGISFYNGMNLVETKERVKCMQSLETVDFFIERCFAESGSDEMVDLCRVIQQMPKVRSLKIRSASYQGRLVDFSVVALTALLRKSNEDEHHESATTTTTTSSLETLQLTGLNLVAFSSENSNDIQELALAIKSHQTSLLIAFHLRSCSFRGIGEGTASNNNLDSLLLALGTLSQLRHVELHASAMGQLGDVSDHQSWEAIFSLPRLEALSLEGIVLKPGQLAVISQTIRQKRYENSKSTTTPSCSLKSLKLHTPIYSYNDDEELPLADALRDNHCGLEELTLELYTEPDNGNAKSFSTRNLFMDLISALEVNESVKKLSVTTKGYNQYNKLSPETLEALIEMLRHKNVTLESIDFHRKTAHFIPRERRKQLQFYLSLNKSGLRRKLLQGPTKPKEWVDALASGLITDVATVHYLLKNQPAIITPS